VHANRNSQHGAHGDQICADVSVGNCSVVSAPVVHYAVSVFERAFFAVASWCEPCAGPCIVSTFPECIGYVCRKTYCPSFSDLKNRSKTFYKVQTDHGSRHLSLCLESGGESAAAEISVVSCVPGGCGHNSFLIFLSYVPPFFHNSVSVFIFCLSVGIQTACAGVDQMDETAVFFCNAFKVISCYSLNSVRAPVCTNICEHLRAVGKEFHEHHSETVQYVVLCCQDVGLSCAFPVKGSIQHSLREVSVGIEVCPLSLTLETSCQSIVSDRFLREFRIQFVAAVHQLFDDNSHLNNELELFFFLLVCHLQFRRVLVEADLAGFFRPFQSFLKFSVIVDTFCHTADDLNLVNRLYSHSKIGLDEILINDGSADTHGNGTDLQIGFASHGSSSNCRASES